MSSSPVDTLKQQKRALIEAYARPSDMRALAQILVTVIPLAALWWAAIAAASISLWLTATVGLALGLLYVRVFVLMHDCGHGSMFRTPWLNDVFGFVMGVLSGMPQYVWSQHHAFHHATNGNWEKYQGPLNTRKVSDYARMSPGKQRIYRGLRTIWMAPLGGFAYLIFNPRFNWIKGSLQLAAHVLRGKLAHPATSLREHASSFKTPHWETWKEYAHQTGNNFVLLSLWAVMCWWIGPALFFAIYLGSLSLGGAGAILLFTVQHNFEHAYATGDEGWDYDVAAIKGTSFMVLPGWLNWFTSNIAYHHVHHISARIPNYHLAECHKQYEALFADVKRIGLGEVVHSLKYILWDTDAQRIISVDEYLRSQSSDGNALPAAA